MYYEKIDFKIGIESYSYRNPVFCLMYLLLNHSCVTFQNLVSVINMTATYL